MPTPSAELVFLFTDVEGSTRLWEEHPVEMRSALARHDEILRSSIESHGGSVFKTVGDAFYSTFSEMGAAARAAAQAQRRLSEASWDDTGPIRVRMALHVGPVQQRDRDYFGPTLNRVARVLSAGHGGQVLLSAAAATDLRDCLPADLSIETLGRHRLKDLPELEEIARLRGPGLRDDFPPLKTLAPPPLKLPSSLTAFMGRERELRTLLGLLRSGVRLLTVTGSGGAGKTRLAVEAGAAFGPQLAGGAIFVSLAHVVDFNVVTQEIARACGLHDAAATISPEELGAALADRDLLLLLDNLEQIPDAGLPIERLLERAPRLRVLATSRSPLRIMGEELFALGAMPLDGKGGAVDLFFARAKAVRPGLRVDVETTKTVRAICDRLDGLPLAVELAAARCRALPPSDVLKRLRAGSSETLDLGIRRRSADARHETVRSTLAWSARMLSPKAQRVLAWLGPFTSSVDPAQVGAAVGDPDVGIVLEELADASILTALPDEDARRFRMLCTIQDYAREQLSRLGETDAACAAHLRVFEALVVRPEWRHRVVYDQGWLAVAAREHDNIIAAIDRALSWAPDSALRMVGRLQPYWFARGHLRLGHTKIAAALAARPNGDPFDRAWAMTALALVKFNLGELDGVLELYDQAGALFEKSGTPADLARINQYRAYYQMATGRHEEAERIGEESLRQHRVDGDDFGASNALHTLGENARAMGRLDLAKSRYEEALRVRRKISDPRGEALSSAGLAYVALACARPEARAHAARTLELHAGNKDPYGVVHALNLAARVALACGGEARALKAARLLGAARELQERINLKIDPFDSKDFDAVQAALSAALPDDRRERALAEGASLDQDQAVALGLEVLSS